MRDPNGPGRDVGACDTALMGQGARPAARTSGPFGSVFWPAELLERVLPETLALAAARLDGIGRCAVCRTTLGAAPWVALTAAAAGPFGAWTVQGHLAHPDCVNEGAALWQMAGESTLPEPTTVVGLAHHHIAGSEAEPVITVRPSVDAFHFGVGPRSAQVVDHVLQRYAQLGWEQLPDGAEFTAAAPASAVLAISGAGGTLDTGCELLHLDVDVMVAGELDQLGSVGTLIGVALRGDGGFIVDRKLLDPGVLHGRVQVTVR